MSVEEDTELRDLVTQTLDMNGCLPKIRVSFINLPQICILLQTFNHI